MLSNQFTVDAEHWSPRAQQIIYVASALPGKEKFMTNQSSITDPLDHTAAISRRQLLQTGMGVAGALAIPGVLASAAAASSKASSINVLMWNNYNVPGMKMPNVKATWTYMAATQDLFTKTAQAGTFDVVNPASVDTVDMVKAGRLQPLDASRIPNLSQVAPAMSAPERNWAFVGGKRYAVPLVYYHSYAIWNKKKTTQPKTFNDLLKPELKGKVGVSDDDFWIHVMGNLAGFKGSLYTHQQLDTIIKMFQKLKPQVGVVYPYGNEPEVLSRGTAWVTPNSLLSEIAAVRHASVDAGAAFFGSYGANDALAIPTGAPNLNAAYAWINNALGVTAQASLAAGAVNPVNAHVPKSKIPQAVSEFGPLSQQLKHAPIMTNLPSTGSGKYVGLADWDSAWEQIKASL
jgi:spermidine/putrescine transport system substrate-binding protein